MDSKKKKHKVRSTVSVFLVAVGKRSFSTSSVRVLTLLSGFCCDYDCHIRSEPNCIGVSSAVILFGALPVANGSTAIYDARWFSV